jgi:hypothetical protein
MEILLVRMHSAYKDVPDIDGLRSLELAICARSTLTIGRLFGFAFAGVFLLRHGLINDSDDSGAETWQIRNSNNPVRGFNPGITADEANSNHVRDAEMLGRGYLWQLM